ncbi:MAG: EscU/YscU/HrcU family type III secretion system export apparatus switch protein [Acidobacteriota bacterium]|nr:EscU/YscU/HrcU family type III secretion system export apparatus switch protein [Acidobacteriota bacterium]
MADKFQQTEKPTPRRLEKARREGQFPAAKDFVAAMQFIAFVALLGSWGGRWMTQNRRSTRILFERAFDTTLTPAGLTSLCTNVLSQTLLHLAILGGVLMAVTLAFQLLSTRFGLSLTKLSPDLKRMNPFTKVKELPRQNLPALIQALFLLPIFGYSVYWIAKDRLEEYFLLPLSSVETGAAIVGASVQNLLWKGASIFLVFGLVNLVRQQRRYTKDLMMSRQQIKDESKDNDGNPQIKRRIRRLQRDMRRRHMMKEVPTATAVIVNPTHYAVAIKYSMDSMAAPSVVAKGKNYLALRIKRKAIENQVPIVENPPLAQALYKAVDVGQEIPAELYRAVAEILAYIYKLMGARK